MPGCRNPVRIICDTTLRTPLSAKVIQTAKEVKTILATACRDPQIMEPYRECGCHIIQVDDKNGQIDLKQLMYKLGAEKIDSILLEGGGSLNWGALHSGIVQKVQAYIAPKLIGGVFAKTPLGGSGVPKVDQAITLVNSRIVRLGDDFMIESEVG